MNAFAQKVQPWTAFGFSVFLACLPVIGMIWRPAGGGTSEWWQPAFFCFLPMCFFYIGASLQASRLEMQKLRGEIDDLRAKLP